MPSKKEKVKKDFDSLGFAEMNVAKKMKYILAYENMIDLPKCYGFATKKEMKWWLKEGNGGGKITAFEVKLIGIFH